MRQALQFRAMCHLHGSDVYRYARHLLGNAADAEDASQEILLKLWRNIDAVSLLKTRAWLMQTTRNHCLDVLRRRKRQLLEPLDAEEMPEQPDPHSPDPRKCAQMAGLREEIDSALQMLPEKQRSVFILREVNGLRYEEVASALEMPLNSVKVYLMRARERLQTLLKDNRSPSAQDAHGQATEEANA